MDLRSPGTLPFINPQSGFSFQNFIYINPISSLRKPTNGLSLLLFLKCSDPLTVFFIHSWLHWVFVALRRVSLVAASGATLCCGAWASHCSGFSCCRAQALGARASVVAAQMLRSCGSQTLLLHDL